MAYQLLPEKAKAGKQNEYAFMAGINFLFQKLKYQITKVADYIGVKSLHAITSDTNTQTFCFQ